MADSNLLNMRRRLERCQRQWLLPGRLPISGGLDHRSAGDRYDFDGMARPDPAAQPYLIFQYTLAGEGRFQDSRGVYALRPGQAFVAVVPSAHRYFLPSDSAASWTFFFLSIEHEYVVTRVAQRLATSPAVLTLSPRSALATHASGMVEGLNTGSLHDRSDIELACFQFLVSYDLAAKLAADPNPQRQVLLAEVREQVLSRLSRRLDVETIAAAHGMSRSHFTRMFHRVTGLTPARFAIHVRLEEARRWLSSTGDKLTTIARRTGFADANHLVKAFHRRYRTSPGIFRAQQQRS
jgi:AraC-like DNA-binding protein